MTVAVGTASPRLYGRYTRHRTRARLRYGQQQNAFLATQANRLSSTVAIVYARLAKYTADQISRAANIAALPLS